MGQFWVEKPVAPGSVLSGNQQPGGKVREEPLLNALVKQLDVQPVLKADGLLELKKQGWVLIDATYEPVNGKTRRERNEVIERDYDELCGDLKRLLGVRWCDVPLVLIKANVCRLLEPKLKKDGFKVLNKEGRLVYFPSTGNQGHFDRQFRAIVPKTLPSAGTPTLP